MGKASYLMLALAWPVFACAQAEDAYTTAEAARKAQLLITEAHALRTRVAEVCNDARATGLLYELAEEVVRKLDEWPDDHRPLAPYHACRQSMTDVQSYAYTCANGGYKGKAAEYMRRQWVEDSTSCDDAIRASGLAPKDGG